MRVDGPDHEPQGPRAYLSADEAGAGRRAGRRAARASASAATHTTSASAGTEAATETNTEGKSLMVQPAEAVAPEAPVALDAETAALIAQGAALDAGAAPPAIDPATGQPPAPIDYAAEAAELVGLVCSSAEAIFEDSGLQFSEPTRAKLAGAWAPVLEKYDLTGAGLFGEYRAEIGAAIVTVPVILAARKVIRAGKKDKAPPGDGGETLPTPMDFATA